MGSAGAVGRVLGMAIVLLLVVGVLGVAVVPSPSPSPTSTTTALPPAAAPSTPHTPATTTTTRLRVGTTTSTVALPSTAEAPGPVLHVTGRILDDSGRGVPGAELLFGKQAGLFEGLGSMFGGLFGGCSGPATSVECRWLTTGTTQADGSYALRLRLTLEEARRVGPLALRVTWPQVSTAQVPVALDHDPYRVPDVTLWRPDLQVEEGRATWRPFPRDDARYHLSFTGGGPFGKDPVLEVGKASATGAAFEHRLLEDVAETAVVTATVLDEVHASLPLTVRGPGAPPTRDRPCQVVPDDSNERPIDFATCPITKASARDRLPGFPEAHRLIVDLGSSRTLSLAVVGGSVDFAVDVSDDGTTWTELVDSEGALEPMPNVQLAYAREPRTGRYVRLRLPERSFGLFFVPRLAVW